MFKNEKGLTLIELLITIAVIAVVAAISVPVVSNVIAASNTNSLSAMQEQVDQFVAEAAESGTVRLSADATKLEALIDQNGDGVDEYLVKTFPVDSKYTVSGTGDGPYTISTSGAAAPAGPTVLATINIADTLYGSDIDLIDNGSSEYVYLRFSIDSAADIAFRDNIANATSVRLTKDGVSTIYTIASYQETFRMMGYTNSEVYLVGDNFAASVDNFDKLELLD